MSAVSNTQPSGNWIEIKKIQFRRRLGGILGVAVATYLLTLTTPGPLLGLFALIISGVVGFLPSAAVRAERAKNKRAQTVWSEAKCTFDKSACNSYFIHLRQEADKLTTQLGELHSEESNRLTELTNRKRELQLRHYLDKHDIDQVKIKGIGNARKITLKSYGIETAADVDYKRVIAISGFGPSTAKSLVAWQNNVKLGFRFDPNLAVDPADIAAMKASIAAKRTDLETRARQTVDKLKKAAAETAAIRADPGREVRDAWAAWSSAQEFEKQLSASAGEVVKLAAVGTVSAVSLFSYSTLIVSVSPFLVESQKELDSGNSTHGAELPSGRSGSIAAEAGLTSPETAHGSAADQPMGPPTVPTVGVTEAAPASPEPPKGVAAEEAKPLPTPPLGIVPVAPTREPPLEPGTVAIPAHNPLNRPDAIRIQARLRELGFYSVNIDGAWGPNSRAALQAFKNQNGLPADGTWDAATESKLLGLAQARMDQAFEGSWAQHPTDCGIGGTSAPVRISQKGSQAKDGNCEFQDVRREGVGWHVRGVCNAGGKSRETDIHLSMVGGALTWASDHGVVAYFRCR
jgi:Putative peptidoglycan binding domain